MACHIHNLHNFISVKCNGNDKMEKYFLQALIQSKKIKSIIRNQKGIVDKLNKKQTVMQYLRSNGSIRNFVKNNAERHKLIGARTSHSEAVISQAIRDEHITNRIISKVHWKSRNQMLKVITDKYKNILRFVVIPWSKSVLH